MCNGVFSVCGVHMCVGVGVCMVNCAVCMCAVKCVVMYFYSNTSTPPPLPFPFLPSTPSQVFHAGVSGGS